MRPCRLAECALTKCDCPPPCAASCTICIVAHTCRSSPLLSRGQPALFFSHRGLVSQSHNGLAELPLRLEHATTLGRKVLARWRRLSRHEQSEYAARLVAHDDGAPTVATGPTQHGSSEKALLSALQCGTAHSAAPDSPAYTLNLCAAAVLQPCSFRRRCLCARARARARRCVSCRVGVNARRSPKNSFLPV